MTRSWTVYSVNARVGAPGHSTVRLDLARLTPLPSAASPKVMFMGVLAGGHEAVFALAAGVGGRGAGLCRPSHARCAAIVLRRGQVERLTFTGASGVTQTLVLELSRIASRRTHSQSTALSAYHRSSKAGSCELDLADPIVYNPSTGSMSEVSTAACRHVTAPVPFPGPLG